MAEAFENIVRSVDRFIDVSRRFFVIAERWNNGMTQVPLEGVDWVEPRKFEALELRLSLCVLRTTVDRFMGDCEGVPNTLPAQWQIIIRSAANLANHACNDGSWQESQSS